jgi:multidrug efflux system outer membrane protein
MRHRLVSFVFGIPVLLCGCTVGPNYHAPQTSIEGSFGRGWQPAASQPSLVTMSPMTATRWWQTLHDPLLDKLIERTVVSNLDVKIAQARVRQARAEFAYAAGGQYPSVNADAGYSHNRLSKTAAPFNTFNVPGFP